jgi:CDP-diglyceride synthetase
MLVRCSFLAMHFVLSFIFCLYILAFAMFGLCRKISLSCLINVTYKLTLKVEIDQARTIQCTPTFGSDSEGKCLLFLAMCLCMCVCAHYVYLFCSTLYKIFAIFSLSFECYLCAEVCDWRFEILHLRTKK